jgi:hypothetical protein
MVSQLWESPQLVPSPFPVHVGSEDALAAIGPSELPNSAPARAATLSLSGSQQLDHLVMITSHDLGRLPLSGAGSNGSDTASATRPFSRESDPKAAPPTEGRFYQFLIETLS